VIVFVLLEDEDGMTPDLFKRELTEWCDDWRDPTDPDVRVYVVKGDKEIS